MRLDVRTIIFLRHPSEPLLLLLKRSAAKKLFPNLITGVGGAVELAQGEGEDLEAAALRELFEETSLAPGDVQSLRLRLTTLEACGGDIVILLWFTARLLREKPELRSPDGDLQFHPYDDLPLDGMIPTAREAIRWILSQQESAPAAVGHFTRDLAGRLYLHAPPAQNEGPS